MADHKNNTPERKMAAPSTTGSQDQPKEAGDGNEKTGDAKSDATPAKK